MATSDQLDRLQAQLLVSGLQQSNPALYQVIWQLIKNAKDVLTALTAITTASGGVLANATFLTADSEIASLPNSKELVAGTFITFDDSVFGQRIVNSSGGGSSVDHVVLSDGVQPPTPVDDGAGNFIYIPYVP